MSDFLDMARDPKFRGHFEKLLRLAAARGDADLVAERLGWGIDPNCRSKRGRTPLIVNVGGISPSVATVQALLKAGADPSLSEDRGYTALDLARRKLLKINLKPRKKPEPSPSLDENGQLQLGPEEQAEVDRMREEIGDPEFIHIYWKERLRAAKRVFNDPDQIERIVEILEAKSQPEA
jgi:hypothetical protein